MNAIATVPFSNVLVPRIHFILRTFSWSKRFLLYILEHFSHVDADPHEVALWVLLKRTMSADKAIRLQAVQELAEHHHWQGKIYKIVDYQFSFTVNLSDQFTPVVNNADYQYQTAAQAIDQRTAVGLARIPQVDLRFFLRSPALPALGDVSISVDWSIM